AIKSRAGPSAFASGAAAICFRFIDMTSRASGAKYARGSSARAIEAIAKTPKARICFMRRFLGPFEKQSNNAANEAFQITRLRTRDRDRMIDVLAAAFEDLDLPAGVHGNLGHDLFDGRTLDQPRAATHDEDAVGPERANGVAEQRAVAAQ